MAVSSNNEIENVYFASFFSCCSWCCYRCLMGVSWERSLCSTPRVHFSEFMPVVSMTAFLIQLLAIPVIFFIEVSAVSAVSVWNCRWKLVTDDTLMWKMDMSNFAVRFKECHLKFNKKHLKNIQCSVNPCQTWLQWIHMQYFRLGSGDRGLKMNLNI